MKLFTTKKIIVFDFDGVLVDSVEVKTEAFAELYMRHGQQVVEQVVQYHREHGGVSRFDKFRHFHTIFLGQTISKNQAQNLASQFSAIVMDKVVQAPSITGADDFLRYCQTQQLDCAVNSATPQDEIRLIVERRGLSKFFNYVLGSPATKSANLSKLIKLYQCSVDEMVFFGDADSDFHAAAEHGVEFVGIGSWMQQYHTDDCLVFSDFCELMEKV